MKREIMQANPTMRRSIGVPGAVLLGLGSIVGTGIFVSVGVAAQLAGPAVLVAVVIAAVIAACNGLASAQLAAAHPVAGGSYEYGYVYLNPAAGFTAGWLFIMAKTASAATAALGIAAYVMAGLGLGGRAATIAAGAGTAIAVTGVVLSGLRRSIRLNALLLAIAISALLVFVVAGAPQVRMESFSPLVGDTPALLEATALMFVAFTGYGRIATIGEEVRNPSRNIPLAIVATLAASAVLYVVVAAVLVGTTPKGDFSMIPQGASLGQAARAFEVPAAVWWIGLGAVVAMLGVLLNLVLGLSRVWLAMGRRGDMPRVLSRVNTAGTTPVPAVLVTGMLIAALTLVGDLRLTWSFSAFAVLVYYAITNAAALRLPASQRRYPLLLSWLGLAGCVFLAFWVQWEVWAAGLGLVALGLVWHWIARRRAVKPAL